MSAPSRLWSYVPNPDAKQPWFEHDCELYEVAFEGAERTSRHHFDETLVEAYRVLEGLPDGLHNSRALGKLGGTLMHAIDADVKRYRSRSAFRVHSQHVCLARRENEAIDATLTSQPYRDLGLSLSTVTNGWWVSKQAEHRFLFFGPSGIPGAGLGLFVRPGRLLRAGTVVCEYAGVPELRQRRGHETYTVKLKSGRLISGLTDDGSIAHLAALANDNGKHANCALQEFAELPDRAFFVALRDLEPEEEVFVQYGASYWGSETYRDLENAADSTAPAEPSKKKGHRREVAPVDVLEEMSQKSYCRCCKAFVDRRVFGLHRVACADQQAALPLPFTELNCLPLNPFTCCAETASDEEQRRAVYFVTSIRATQVFTHEVLE
jgi:hypothetical protein